MNWHLTLPPRDVVGPSVIGAVSAGMIVAGVYLGFVTGALIWSRPSHGAELSHNSSSESCLPSALRSALADVRAACGPVKVISTLRPHSRIPTGHVSLHAACQAVDFMPSNCSCAYRVLSDWKFGLSLDCARMRHIHLSAPGIRNEGRFYHHGTTIAAKRKGGADASVLTSLPMREAGALR
jgi:hypothetical protein